MHCSSILGLLFTTLISLACGEIIDISEQIANLQVEEVLNKQCAGEFVLLVDETATNNTLIVETSIENLDVGVDTNLSEEDKDEIMIYTNIGLVTSAYLRITLTLKTATLQEYKQTRSVDAYLAGKAFSGELSAKTSGSGDIYIKDLGNGPFEKLALETTGSGDVIVDGILEAAKVSEVEIQATGSGDIHVNGLNVGDENQFSEFEAKTIGSGDICVSGPKFWAENLESNTLGSGNIRFKMDEGVVQTVVSSSTGSGGIDICTVNGLVHEVTVLGSGGVKLRSDSGSVTGKTAGSGDIRYLTGAAATVNVDELGSGDAVKIDSCGSISSCNTGMSLPSSPKQFTNFGCSRATRISAFESTIVVAAVVIATFVLG